MVSRPDSPVTKVIPEYLILSDRFANDFYSYNDLDGVQGSCDTGDPGQLWISAELIMLYVRWAAFQELATTESSDPKPACW